MLHNFPLATQKILYFQFAKQIIREPKDKKANATFYRLWTDFCIKVHKSTKAMAIFCILILQQKLKKVDTGGPQDEICIESPFQNLFKKCSWNSPRTISNHKFTE